jgi:hypothetical protein
MATHTRARGGGVCVSGCHIRLMHVVRVVCANLVHAVLVFNTEANPRYALLTKRRGLMVMQLSTFSSVGLRSALWRRGLERVLSVHGWGI